jgi:hypothetical protein
MAANDTPVAGTCCWSTLLLGVGLPVVAAPDQVGADDDPAPVVLEALGGVDAAHLAEPGWLGRPV